MAFVEDFTVFFTDFGVTATPSAGDPFTVIFDRAHVEAMGGEVSALGPVALAQDTDVANLALRSALAIGGTSYTVREKQPDGTGLTLLILGDA